MFWLNMWIYINVNLETSVDLTKFILIYYNFYKENFFARSRIWTWVSIITCWCTFNNTWILNVVSLKLYIHFWINGFFIQDSAITLTADQSMGALSVVFDNEVIVNWDFMIFSYGKSYNIDLMWAVLIC